MKGRELRRHQIRLAVRVVEAAPCRNRILRFVGEALVEESPRTVHFTRPYVRVPIRDRSKPRPRVEVHARQTERRWNQRAGLFAVRAERFAVVVEYGIEPTRPPAREHLLHGGSIDAERIAERFQIRSERRDGSNIEIAVGPSIEPLADTG